MMWSFDHIKRILAPKSGDIVRMYIESVGGKVCFYCLCFVSKQVGTFFP